MFNRPAVVAFDVIETVFSLESLRPRFEAEGLPGHMLETWFARLLRDAMALEASGVYRAFSDLANAVLEDMLAGAEPNKSDTCQPGKGKSGDKVKKIMEGLSELEAHPDVAPAMGSLCKAGVRVVALTNGSAGVTQKLLERNRLDQFVERTVSVDGVKRWKPRPEVYHYCAQVCGVEAQQLALIAAHAWDVHGARCAGLLTGYVSREGKPFPGVMEEPHAIGASLGEVADRLLNIAE